MASKWDAHWPASHEKLCGLARDGWEGRGWYAKAYDEIVEVCGDEGWDTERFAGVLAVTSPRCSVRRNIRNTLQYVGAGRLLANTMQGIRSAVACFEEEGKIRGPKTRAFRDALLGVGNAVVLDVHMARALDIPQTAFDVVRVRGRCEQAVHAVAVDLGICSADAQACIWYGQKLRVGENPEGFPIVEEWKNWLAHGRAFNDSGYIEMKV